MIDDDCCCYSSFFLSSVALVIESTNRNLTSNASFFHIDLHAELNKFSRTRISCSITLDEVYRVDLQFHFAKKNASRTFSTSMQFDRVE